MATKISEHFSLEELTTTSIRDVDNTPSPTERDNLSKLANEQLEQVRALWGCGVHVNSGFRSPAVNAKVGGAKTSQHTLGCAADIVPTGEITLKQAYELIKNSQLQFDQLIYEFGSWIHVSRALDSKSYRRQCLMIGKWTNGKYLPYDPAAIKG